MKPKNKVYHFWVMVKGCDFELNGFYSRLEQNLISAELGLRDLLKYSFGDVELEIKHLPNAETLVAA